jgi:hypothetical protein
MNRKTRNIKEIYGMWDAEKALKVEIPIDSFDDLEKKFSEKFKPGQYNSMKEVVEKIAHEYQKILTGHGYVQIIPHNDADGLGSAVQVLLCSRDLNGGFEDWESERLKVYPVHEFGHWGGNIYSDLTGKKKGISIVMMDQRPQDMKPFAILPKLMEDGTVDKFLIIDHHMENSVIPETFLYELKEKFPEKVEIFNVARDVKGLQAEEVPCSSELHYMVFRNMAEYLSDQIDMKYDEVLECGNSYAIAAMQGMVCDRREDSATGREILTENPRLGESKAGKGTFSAFIQNNAIFNSAITAGWDKGVEAAQKSLLGACLRKDPEFITGGFASEEKYPRGKDFSRSFIQSLEELHFYSEKWDSSCIQRYLRLRGVYDINKENIPDSLSFIFVDGEKPLYNFRDRFMGRVHDFYIHRPLANGLCSTYIYDKKNIPSVGLAAVSYRFLPSKWRVRGSLRKINRTSNLNLGRASNMVVKYLVEKAAESTESIKLKNAGAPRGGGHKDAAGIDLPYDLLEIVFEGKPFDLIRNLYVSALNDSLHW